MKKRLISLVLTAAMLFSVMLTGCGSTSTDDENIEGINDEASRYTTTLNMWLVTEKETTPEAAAAVSEAFNKITKAKFKTQVNMYFYTEDEYYEALDAKIEAIEAEVLAEEEARKERRRLEKEARAKGETLATTTVPETEVTEEETVLNEWGVSELKYPEESSRQIDIIFLSGYERYKDYIDRDVLQPLDNELKSSAKKLKDYINPVLLEAAAVDGGPVYAIPNNKQIGEYTFLLINKEMAEKYSYDQSEFASMNDALNFVTDVVAHEPNITPIVGDLKLTNLMYLTIDKNTLGFSEEPSVVAAQLTKSATYGTYLSFRNLFKIRTYETQMKDLKTIEVNNYYDPKASLDDPFLVAMLTGTADIMDQYSDKYWSVVLENPMAYREDLYSGMFAVTNYTKDLTRSMEIVTYFNTNSELRNILQYGIEGVNYTIDPDTGALTMLNNSYTMDIEKTGNAFVAYHPVKGNDPTAWDAAKKQNLDARMEPALGFSFADSELDLTLIDKIAQISKDSFAKIEACQTPDEVAAVIDELDALLTADETVTMYSSIKPDYPNSACAIYNNWHSMMWPDPE